MSAGGEQTRGGRVLGGRYRLTRRIGSGGMGTVWEAHDELVDRDVAVKQPRLPGDPEDEQHQRAAHRLYREARAAARVDHPSAVSILDVVVDEDGLPWIVMELVRGESLHEVLRRGPVDAVEAARIGLAVLGALRAAHSVGIVHRDVKPANVLLGPRGRVVLTDFGIAHVQGEESLTVSGEFVGSLEFVAPERMSGRGAGPSSDLWSLGVLLYAAVEGASPFRRTAVESTLAAVITADPPEPRRAGPLGPLIARLLVKDSGQRPGPEEIGAVLEAVAEGWPVPRVEERMTEAQDAEDLEEFGHDVGTVRLEAKPPKPGPERGSHPGPDADAEPSAGPPPGTVSASGGAGEPDTANLPHAPKRALRVRPVPLAAVAALLVGGTWFGTSYFAGSGEDAGVSEQTATLTETPARATPSAAAWTAHRDVATDAVLYLPKGYRKLYWTDQGGDEARWSVYNDGAEEVIAVYFIEWPKALAAPMDEAKKTVTGMEGHQRTGGQYTATTFHGDEAAQSDVTYMNDGKRVRVLQLVVRTADDRMYQLQVWMPKGTPDEKQGTAVFKGARDRLLIREDRTTTRRARPTP
ncbi:serine/threonine-protein kinase [Streptomyces griseorubiginosus]|uniref:serine/threonine-protein kinase n=1 Tax=Streptomyces griseorubiginosus TaxID=67304 RepID=UPI001AD7A950|nr:serine/threonine-protein kinase [Streptomyces griseorubiginosus]MBO4259649.1 protein kinase [Streptomyces griseorubiginosus]